MIFYDWMLTIGLKKKTASNYAGALTGVLSEWAQDSKIIKGSLIEVNDPIQFKEICREVENLDIFLTRNKRGHGMYNATLKKFTEYLESNAVHDTSDDILEIVSNPSINSTEKQSLIKARIGQGLYRQKLIDYWGACSVTGYSDSTILIASHIKPWAACTNQERLDPYNGLLLLPNLDKLFDRGYISFSKEGNLIISTALKQDAVLGLTENVKICLDNKHQPYMDYHRENRFIGT